MVITWTSVKTSPTLRWKHDKVKPFGDGKPVHDDVILKLSPRVNVTMQKHGNEKVWHRHLVWAKTSSAPFSLWIKLKAPELSQKPNVSRHLCCFWCKRRSCVTSVQILLQSVMFGNIKSQILKQNWSFHQIYILVWGSNNPSSDLAFMVYPASCGQGLRWLEKEAAISGFLRTY